MGNSEVIRNDITGIADRALYRSILEQLKDKRVYVKDNLLTEEILANMDYLHISSALDIKGIEYCKNLKTLVLANTNVSDISPVGALNHLECLSLGSNKIDDVSPIGNMIHLKKLYLGHNMIMDISPLGNLLNLESLSLRGNEIVDLTPLVNLTKLKSLSLEQNEIKDISVLSRLVNLTHLYISENDITDICALESIYNLEHLYMDYNDVNDITPLVGMMNLKSLALEGNFLTIDDIDNCLFQDFVQTEEWLEKNGFDLDEIVEENNIVDKYEILKEKVKSKAKIYRKMDIEKLPTKKDLVKVGGVVLLGVAGIAALKNKNK